MVEYEQQSMRMDEVHAKDEADRDRDLQAHPQPQRPRTTPRSPLWPRGVHSTMPYEQDESLQGLLDAFDRGAELITRKPSAAEEEEQR